MPIKAVKSWIDTYEPGIQKHFDAMGKGLPDKIEDFWQKWVDSNGQGLEVGPPYATKGTTMPTAFSLSLPPTGTAPIIAQLMATAWKGWFQAITFAPPAPAPPFSAILSVTASPVGLALAYSTLLAGLIAEMAIIPPDPASAFKLKAAKYGLLFYTATISVGVQIDGLSMSAPPVPLSLPLFPAL